MTAVAAGLPDDGDAAAPAGDDDLPLAGEPGDDVHVGDVHRRGGGDDLAPATALRVLLIYGAGLGGQAFRFFGRVERAYGFGRILEHRVLGVDFHPRHQGDDPAGGDAARVQDAVHRRLDHVRDGPLGLRAAHVHGHFLKPEGVSAGLLLEQDVAYLGTVPVADDDVIAPPDEREDLPASVFDVLKLFLVGPFLVASEQRVAAEGEHG